jgi:hypothetical protein
MTLEEKLNLFLERNCPNDPGKWSASKALAKSKFDVYPSAYGNAFAAKNYKSKGGTWKKCNEGEMNALCEDCWDGYKQVGGKIKNGKQVPNCVPINEEEVSPEHQKEMIEGIAEIVKGVKNITNRKELAKKQIKQLKSEGIEFDIKEFLSMCGFKSGLKEGAGIPDRRSYLESESEEIERTSDDLDIPYDDIRDSLMNGKEITLDDKMWSRLENTDSYHIKGKEQAIKLANNYGKDWKSIEDAEETPPALILQYEPNKYYLVGGNTRLMFAKANKTNPKVILGIVDQEIDEYDVETIQEFQDFKQFIREYATMINEANCNCITEAEYHGRKVQLGKPMQGDIKKFKVFVKNPAGKVVKVNFGQKGMVIKKNNPKRRKSFRARMHCDNPGPRTSARFWSCRAW